MKVTLSPCATWLMIESSAPLSTLATEALVSSGWASLSDSNRASEKAVLETAAFAAAGGGEADDGGGGAAAAARAPSSAAAAPSAAAPSLGAAAAEAFSDDWAWDDPRALRLEPRPATWTWEPTPKARRCGAARAGSGGNAPI